jgi:diguanylate cyclase (GGDEF)-like protein/PAS domain S-box-containing protein
MGARPTFLAVGLPSSDVEDLLAVLRQGGYTPACKRVETIHEVTAALDRHACDFIVAAYPLPEGPGAGAFEKLRASAPNVPVILSAPALDGAIAVDALREGVDDYVLGGDGERWLSVVTRVLRERDARQQRQETLAALEETTERLRLAIRAGQLYTWDWDLNSNRVIRNGSYEEVFGQEAGAGETDFLSFLRVIHPEDRPRMAAITEQVRRGHPSFRIEFRVVRSDGAIRWLATQARTCFDAAGTPIRVIGVTRDYSEQKAAEDLIQSLAYYDSVTGLPNRNKLYDHLLDAIRIASAESHPFALFLMDLDHFKDINDTLGHHQGDLLLKELGRRLKDALFQPDIVARLGGDEFAILLPRLAKASDVTLVIAKIQAALQPTFLIGGLPIALEASIGVAVYPDHGQDSDSLLQRADVAMYAAKRGGHGHVIYESRHDLHSPLRLALMGELRQGIEHDHLRLYYQPKIDLRTGAVYGVEALVRWQHPLRGLIPPDEFIAPAERSGLIHPLTDWVLRTAMRQCAAWNRIGVKLVVSANLSVRSLTDPHLPDTLAALLRDEGLSAHQIRLEITESAIMADAVRTQETLAKLHGMGIGLSIDDFGIGYSSLSYLRKLPVDRIKVDKSFVMDMLQNEDDAMIVRSTIQLAHNLRLAVVAEGVETKAIYHQLVEWGCDAAQGYYISKPLPAPDLERWLTESPWGGGIVHPSAA